MFRVPRFTLCTEQKICTGTVINLALKNRVRHRPGSDHQTLRLR